MTSSINRSRRSLFRRNSSSVIRPPWINEDDEFTNLCTRCDKCIDACETQIIFRGDGGFPEINFKQDECTFCKQCAQACPEPIFTNTELEPWQNIATINETCLVNQGVWCQSCKDACETNAIKFTMALGKPPTPEIQIEQCTGCGACVAPCPANAITVTLPK